MESKTKRQAGVLQSFQGAVPTLLVYRVMNEDAQN